MKLIYYVIIRISLVLSVLLTGWAILFYFTVMDEVNDEVDDSLEDYSEIIIIRALAGEELPSKNTASNNQYFLLSLIHIWKCLPCRAKPLFERLFHLFSVLIQSVHPPIKILL